MPAATQYYNAPIFNFGPLTTTFTADASCATRAASLAYLSSASFNGTAQSGYHSWAYPNCFSTYDPGCVPSASSFASVVDGQIQKPILGPVEFFSPAYVCPSGWETYGIVAHESTATDLSAAGVFSTQTQDLMSLLLPGETLVACCPSAWKAELAENVCYSPVGAYVSSSACHYSIPSVDETTINGQPIVTGITPLVAVATTYNKSDVQQLTVVSVTPVINLIYQATDLPNTGSPGGLSQAAQIGIGVGVGVGVVILGTLLGAFLLSRRRRQHRETRATAAPEYESEPTKEGGVLDANNRPPGTAISLTPVGHWYGNERIELDQNQQPRMIKTEEIQPMGELPSDFNRAVELPSDEVQRN